MLESPPHYLLSVATLPKLFYSVCTVSISQAAAKALAQLPEGASIDLALVHVSSIYGNAERLEDVVPELRKVVPGLSAVVGCSSAGTIGMQSKGRVVEVSKRIRRKIYVGGREGGREGCLPGVKSRLMFYL